MIGRYTTTTPKRIYEIMKCPMTGEMLTITEGFHQTTLDCYPEFVDILYAEFNTGEPDCNIILRTTLLKFFEKHPEFAIKQFTYTISIYILNTIRCPGFINRPMPGFFYWVMATKTFLTEAVYQNAPPDFKWFLSQIRDPKRFDQFRAAVFVHNCLLIINRLDNFAFATDEYQDYGEVAVPYFNLQWAFKWVFHHVRQLMDEGLLVIHDSNLITVDAYTQNVLDAAKQGRTITGPSRYGIDQIVEESDNKK